MTTKTDALDVITVTYNSRNLIQTCLGSLYEAAPTIPMRVLIADNDSADDTVAVISRDYPQVILRPRPTNDGFAVANNELLNASDGAFVLILNPDTQMEVGTLDHLLQELRDHPDIGVIGCRLLTADGTLDHAAKRAFPSPGTAAKYFLLRAMGRTGSGYVRPDVSDDAVTDIDAINGAFMLMRRTALEEVGGLDERYWMYGEDLDWCARFHAAGWRVVYDGRVVAHHLKGGSTRGRRPFRLNYHFHRSMAIFYRDHTSTKNPFMDVAVISGIWVHFALSSLHLPRRATSEATT